MVTQEQRNSFVQNPVNFLKTNVVRYFGKRFPESSSSMNFVLRDNPQYGRRRNAAGFKVNASSILISNDEVCFQGMPEFKAVWSGYIPGHEQTVSLPAVGGPNIMLTPQLDGCTIAVKLGDDGNTNFSHYNYGHGGETMDKATMVSVALNQHGGGVNTFSKEDYRAMAKGPSPIGVSVTVLGYRKNGVWGFWGQVLENKASGMQIREVRKLG